jgi:fructokinase
VIGLLGLRGEFSHIPFIFDTDVNAPAIAEYNLLSSKYSSTAYMTVGTGVGVGLVVNGSRFAGVYS